MISEQHIYVGFDVGSAGPLAVGLLKLERQGIFESEEFVDGKNYLQDERAIAIHPEIFPLRKEPFQLSQKRLRDGGALPLVFKDTLPDSWGQKSAKDVIENLQTVIPTQLIKNIEKYDGTEQLKSKVQKCIERQHQIIWGQ